MSRGASAMIAGIAKASKQGKRKRSRVRLLVGRVSSVRSRTMASIRAKNTKPELHLRKLLVARGLRYRLHKKALPGRPDIVFPRQKIAVFCDGDFWHGRNWTERKLRIQNGVRSKYWVNKIESNIARDKRVNRELRRAGWTVLRFWETDILKRGDRIAARVQSVVVSRS